MAKENDLVKDSGLDSISKSGARGKSKKKSTKTPAGKPPKSKKTTKTTTSRKKTKSLDPVDVAVADIELRAYFIAERRGKMGWPGDSQSDWLEAERQLREELQRKRRRTKST